MEIKVTSCADCPFAVKLERFILCAKEKKQVSYVTVDDNLPRFCPLKQQSITIKLESNEKEN